MGIPCSGPRPIPCRKLRVGLLRLLQGRFGGNRNEGVERRIQAIDVFKADMGQLD